MEGVSLGCPRREGRSMGPLPNTVCQIFLSGITGMFTLESATVTYHSLNVFPALYFFFCITDDPLFTNLLGFSAVVLFLGRIIFP